jgi:hypothetical protein
LVVKARMIFVCMLNFVFSFAFHLNILKL